MYRLLFVLIVAACALLTPLYASAQDHLEVSQSHAWNPSIGARIGGYGFRSPETDGVPGWETCRMDGSGIFGTFDLNDHLFTELGFDFYHLSNTIVGDQPEGLDRLSLHTQVALGFRMLTGTFFTPYIQVGGGAEWTTVSLTDYDDASGWQPSAFFGIGGDIALGDHFSVGANLRILAMALPEYESYNPNNHEEWSKEEYRRYFYGGERDRSIDLVMSPAGQAQFFLRYTL